MAKYDGSIRIDTRIDTKGADKGISTLTKSLKGFAAMAGVAFGVGAIVQFGKAAVKASSDLSNAMMGLQSIAEGSGRSFEQANKFIQDYISDGLVPATNAVTAYKNLLARGYDTKQIQDIMTRLKDAAAFGRQASYSLGDAVQTASEGLRQENSLLVDNAGVTKNVAKMWQDYAKSIGTTANNLTMAQKRQAEYLGIMEETRFQVGDAQKITQTYSGQVSMLAFNFNNLKVALGNAIIPVLQAVLPHINAAINGLTRLANALASFTGGIFGKPKIVENTQKTAVAAGELAENVGAAGTAAKKAGKDAEKGLAAFDELLTLADTSTAGAGAGASGGGGAIEMEPPEPIELPAVNAATFEESLKRAFDLSKYTLEIDRLKVSWQGLKETFKTIVGELARQFDEVDIKGEAFRGITNILYAIVSAADLAIGAVGNLIVAFDIPATIESALSLIATAAEAVGNVITAITPGVMAFVDIALKPIAEWVGEKVRDAFAFLSEQLTKVGDWFAEHEEDFTALGTSLGELGAALWGIVEPIADAAWEAAKWAIDGIVDGLLEFGEWCLGNKGTIDSMTEAVNLFSSAWDSVLAAWEEHGKPVLEGLEELVTNVTGIIDNAFNTIILPVWEDFMRVAQELWDEHLKPLWDNALDMFGSWAEAALALWNNGLLPVVNWIVSTFGPNIAGAFGHVLNIARTVFGGIAGLINSFITRAKGLAEFVAGVFTGDWKRAWDGIVTAFKGTFEGIATIAKTVINLVIGSVNGMIRAIVSGVNTVIRALNSISFDVPDWIPGIGGNSFGFSFQEIIAPQIPRLAQGAVIPPNREFLAILGDQKRGVNIETPLETMIEAFKTALAEMGGNGQEINLTVNLDGEVVYRNQQSIAARYGRNLMPGVT